MIYSQIIMFHHVHKQIREFWQGKQMCDQRTYVCGISTKFRFGIGEYGTPDQRLEFAGMNDIKLECCPRPLNG